MAGQWKKGAIPPKWDGKAAKRIVEGLEGILSFTSDPSE
jgi:UDP-N-acetylglucosamine 2-epimerase (non-hydrolysing)